MKKFTKITLILLLTLTLVASLAIVAACHDEVATTVNLTVDYNLSDVENTTLTVEKDKPFADKLTPPESGYTFGGWFLADGTEVNGSTLAPQTDFTVKARWLATYHVEYWLLNESGTYQLATDLTVDSYAELGSTVTAEVKQIRGYVFDKNNQNNVTSAELSQNGVTLKLYYKVSDTTITFDKLIESASGTMESISGSYGEKITLPKNTFTSQFKFLGWNTQPDGSGLPLLIKDGDEYTLSGDVTLYAQWETAYTVVSYKESYVEGTFDTEYVKISEVSNAGVIGHSVSAQISNPDGNKYVLNAAKSKSDGVLTEQPTTLASYFDLRKFEVRYMDDNATFEVKYGSSHTVRTPRNTHETYVVGSYCTSASGNGKNYEFGDVITNILSDTTLYPIVWDIYTDDAGSDDTLYLRRDYTGAGGATLIHNGQRYSCYVSAQNNVVQFDLELNNKTVYGKPYVANDTNLFRYRNDEEVGTYIYFDYLFDEFYPSEMIAFDGYGTAVYAMPVQGGELILDYYATYVYEEGVGYWVEYFAVTNPDVVYGMYIELVPYQFDNSDYSKLAGYFMIMGEELYYNPYYLYYNGEVQDWALVLDGHGNAYWYDLEDDSLIEHSIYYASENYEDDYPEYVYVIPQSGSSLFEFDVYFILVPQYDATTDNYYGLVLVRRGEFGSYTATAGEPYPELYLDGYGGALFVTNANDEGRLGSYVIQSYEASYIVIITFHDDDSVFAVSLNKQSKTYTVFEDGFVIDSNGVLTAYYGYSSIIEIPEGVVEIAANVFSYLTIDVNITSVTFPTTLRRIGNHAFENANGAGDSSTLKTVIFRGTVPPELGDDVFRWIKGSNFLIYVPDGYEDAYRNAETWKKAVSGQPNGYAAFVTSFAEQANKPKFEIVDGVLVSYNNKDENPQNVHVEIPTGVTQIAPGVFAGLDYIVSVNLNQVTVIGDRAFYACANLREVTFNPNTVSIGKEAFYECVLITSVNLGNVQSIGAYAFGRCFALVEVTIGSQIQLIDDQAFFMCAQEVNEDETEFVMHDLVVTISATVAPELNQFVFLRSQPRVYVSSYEVGLAFAENSSWARYAASLRVKRSGAEEIWYSKANAGAMLVLGDAVMFDENYIGLYKWEGSTLYISWFEYGAFYQTLVIMDSQLTLNGSELSGLYFDNELTGGRDNYVFVAAGTTLTYTNGDETLEVTFGTTDGKFNGQKIQIDIVNYRMQFKFDGYIYQLTLTNELTFDYTRTKIVVIKDYVAEDGSTLTIFDGNYVRANGRLKNINGVEIYTETQGWYLTKIADNIYSFRWDHSTGNYSVVITLSDDGTFKYEWSIYSVVTVYRNGGDLAVVTTSSQTGEIMSIRIVFKTANGTEEQTAQILSGSNGTYVVKIDGTVKVADADGYTHDEPSTFNGTYTLILNDAAQSFTLEVVA